MARPEDRLPDRAAPPADEVAAHAFADGYGEGLRDALRDMLQHASRGHTAQELRWLIESRLARVAEEVALKRRALLGPPRRVDWETLLRPPAAPAPTMETSLPGTGILFRDERPDRALGFVLARWRPFGRVLQVGPAGLPPVDVPGAALVRIPLGGSGPDPDGSQSPGAAAGLIDQLLEEGPALVYVEGLTVQVREEGIDPTHRFLEWLLKRVRERSSLLVSWVDPSTLKEIDYRRLYGCFESVR